jgi:hypothetical protein
MLEALLVVGVVGSLVLLGTLAVSLSLEALIVTGLGCMAAGLVLGLPAGAYYHVVLYRCLRAHGDVPDDFIWHPTRHHDALSAEERKRVLPWFAAGALGFGLIMLGCTIFALGFLRT